VVLTARPGRIKTELAIDLPHPRHYTVKTTSRFAEYKATLTEAIREEALKSMAILAATE
jgi:NitT/TauT family transport system ATP-binding protein